MNGSGNFAQADVVSDVLPDVGLLAEPTQEPTLVIPGIGEVYGVPKEPYWSQFLYALVAHEEASDV